ncbi:ribonuclease P protein subunit p25-like protein isoform X2 [Diachasma alloeum]|uniref:ribonuclease P protein subunit p25-like protein isoform X2 n=1 Tax=Diachasma alloeum TaxID=454923 RepID=UPI0007383BB6|nr:ribonuclease P protein subunit p25-like protein isoform X2 [Diachasma alloeum]
MGRSKSKKCRKVVIADEIKEETDENLMRNLPDKLLLMRVKSGTKIRNVFNHAIKEFSKYEGVLWSGAGQAVGKVISCAEMFKREFKGLHQVTKLHYIKSKNNSKDEGNDRQVPEIHICLTKNQFNSTELGYQGPDDNMFQNSSENVSDQGQGSRSKISGIAAEEFAKMGLRTGQKRPRENFKDKTSTKKSKRIP